jgi:hypothetical protein
MTYCTVSDVERLTGAKYTISGRPSTADVDEAIDGVAADLDGAAQASGYTVPVTSTQAIALMKRYNRYGAACEAWHIGHVSLDAPARVEHWCSTYQAFLEALREGKTQLPGEEPESDLDPVFNIVQQPPRDRYWTGEDEPLES